MSEGERPEQEIADPKRGWGTERKNSERKGCDPTGLLAPTLGATTRVEHVGKSMERIRVATSVEGRPLRGPGSEEAIKEKEGDAEVLVHKSLVVQSPVMDVVGLAGRGEPALQPGIALHPETIDVHAVMQI